MRKTLGKAAPAIMIVGTLSGFTALALASPPSGQTGVTSSTGVLAATGNINTERIKLQTKDPADVFHFQVTYAIGGFSGWHTHPGVILATVKSGSIVREVGCDEPIVYSAGDSFIESGEQPAGQVKNLYASSGAPGAQVAVIDAVQIVPRGSARRDESTAPSC